MPKWRWLLSDIFNKLWLRASAFCLIGIFTALIAFFMKDFIPEHISRKVGADSVDAILEIIASSMLQAILPALLPQQDR